MFCHNCGNEIQRENRHCTHCGAVKIMNLAEALATSSFEPTPLNEQHVAKKEERLFKIHPAFFSVGLAYVWAAALAIFATIIIAYLGGSLLWVMVATIFFFTFPLYQHIKWSGVSYILSNAKIEIEQGVVDKSSHYLALWHVQNVTVNESLLDRVLGIGDVLIDSASLADKMALKKIRHPRRYASLILAQLPRTK
jgi:membrane protein YdbS with pleckstrin-like domain